MRNSLGSKGVRELGNTFSSFDKDQNRVVDCQELLNGLQAHGVALSPAESSAVIASFDKNGNGTLDFDEFYQGVVGPISKTKMEMIDDMFDRFDKNGQGCI